MEVLKILDPNTKIGKIKFTGNTDKKVIYFGDYIYGNGELLRY
jgi:hypothetical protein